MDTHIHVKVTCRATRVMRIILLSGHEHMHSEHLHRKSERKKPQALKRTIAYTSTDQIHIIELPHNMMRDPEQERDRNRTNRQNPTQRQCKHTHTKIIQTLAVEAYSFIGVWGSVV